LRLTTAFWVAALLRRVAGDGGFGAVEKRGAAEAGAVFVRAMHRDGTETLYAPAPQSMFDDKAESRRFERRTEPLHSLELSDMLAREAAFDQDLWIVGIETDTPERYLDIVED
jgi:hypothetical protein